MAKILDELLPRHEQERIVASIRDAEARSSGQIKVHVEPRCKGDAMARARSLFQSLGLTQTRHRNAVLLYVAPQDRKFAIVGDEGIHAVAGERLWGHAAAKMRECFSRGSLGDGLAAAIGEVGAVLATEFPRQAGAKNELSDEISTGPR